MANSTAPFLLTRAQIRRLSSYFPRSRGIPRVRDRRVLSGIISVIRHGLQWRDAPSAYGPHKTLDNRFVRLRRMGVFDRIIAALATEGGPLLRLMIYATHLKAHRTAASQLKQGAFPRSIGRTEGGRNATLPPSATVRGAPLSCCSRRARQAITVAPR
jgi:transposase